MKAENTDFNEFTFRPFIEYPRYALFIAIWFVPQFYGSYVIMANNPSKSYIELTTKYFEVSLGYTALDIIIVMWIPWVCLTSATFYMISFKKKAGHISKVCLEMAKTKELLSDLLIEREASHKKSKLKISLRLFFSALMISLVILVLYCCSMYLTITQVMVNELSLTKTQMWILIINDFIPSFCWIYPTIAMSADLVTCHILEEMGDIYLSWNKILAYDLRIPHANKYSVYHLMELKENENSETQRYILL